MDFRIPPTPTPTPHSLYLHIPFCSHRCAYCDFNTYAGQEDSIPAYVSALCREVEFVGGNAPADLQVHTIFFGGGTPSLLSSTQLGTIFKALHAAFEIVQETEITLEANPGTVSLQSLVEMRRLGINRISLGMQSTNGEELRLLERQHTFLDVLDALSAARRAGFRNLNVDLIYGLPEQTLQTWQTTVKRLIDLRPEHISAYALTMEHGTPFGRWSSRGLLPAPSPDLAADMYEWISEALEVAGYTHYEISNWAQDGLACRHNLQYWRGLPYLGLGAGAHGYANGYRYSNALRIKTFIDRLGGPGKTGRAGTHDVQGPAYVPQAGSSGWEFPFSPAAVNRHRQTAEDEMSEFMITGLRLTREGIASEEFRRRFGRGLREQYQRELAELTRLGLLEWAQPEPYDGPSSTHARGDGTAEVIRLTPRGRLLGNQVFMMFLDSDPSV